jgi:hypothetical protein
MTDLSVQQVPVSICPQPKQARVIMHGLDHRFTKHLPFCGVFVAFLFAWL